MLLTSILLSKRSLNDAHLTGVRSCCRSTSRWSMNPLRGLDFSNMANLGSNRGSSPGGGAGCDCDWVCIVRELISERGLSTVCGCCGRECPWLSFVGCTSSSSLTAAAACWSVRAVVETNRREDIASGCVDLRKALLGAPMLARLIGR